MDFSLRINKARGNFCAADVDANHALVFRDLGHDQAHVVVDL
jgi:hypothetical protein